MIESSYDVVIAGAGPGGSITARDCAKSGLKVLLLEKRPEIGAPKRCGEGLSLDGLKQIGYTENEKFVAQTITNGIFIAPNGKRIEIPKGDGGVILERKLFDKYLAYDAAKAGAKVVAKAEVVDVIKKDGKVAGVIVDYYGEKIKVGAKVVVASDGIESKVAKMAGLNTLSSLLNMAPGYQYEMAGIDIEDCHKLYFYFGMSIAPGGYVWVFPKGDHVANVGVGIIAKNDGKTAKYYLDNWIKSMPSIKKGSIIEENAGGIPLGNLLKKMTLDNFLVVGDAAHQVNPVHGGGLFESTFAGQIAAKVISRAINDGDTSDKKLNEYTRLWWEERGNHLAKLEKIMNVVMKLNDDEINSISNSLDGEGFLKIVNADIVFCTKLLMKNPKLAKMAAALI